ncbi:DGQHR domain-containing protein [Agrococcus jenensis]|uniref:DNA sulfur modification protein DndB n=1 Tax=Agrococcus jenensis TaxID=46353 RepID=A0A3N2ARX6_9MICO|nr:DGQHR domain-containing protein [Agrococcus jenensis]ROR65797.1 DNA sulfur modification protein DndB [Agrococcus jenensis]
MQLLDEKAIRSELPKRMSPYVREKIPAVRVPEYLAQQWVIDKELKRDVWMRKLKTHDRAFEDRVWSMFARLGFPSLNADRTLSLPYGANANETKQIDVLAVDDEVLLVVECKSSASDRAPVMTFKTEIEAIQGYRARMIGDLRKRFPDRKVKFVLAINNIAVRRESQDRMEAASIALLDEEAVDYYHELAGHLGPAAKFQLLGNLFAGTQIEAMESAVPAIRGKMGGHTYYSFAIEPERLLKLAYVLHRNNANTRWMPTYQRIIKRARLKKVAAFVEAGGFFPNSLIVNLNNGGRKVRFDSAGQKMGAVDLGVLHLPRKYRSAYIIDGQHRLYGFATSKRAQSELVPVVAFVDLPGEKQLELFMQINENQQSVPKNLQNTLNADLLWGSDDARKRSHALKLKVAQLLGEQKTSPLRGRVILGEEQSSDRRCISLDAIQRGVDRGRYIGEFNASSVKTLGSFYRTSNDDTVGPLVSFLELALDFLRDGLEAQWNLGRADGGFVFTNAGTEAVVRLCGDIVDHCNASGVTDSRNAAPEVVFVHVRPYLSYLVNYLSGLASDDVTEFRGWFGSGAPTKYLRKFQAAIAAEDASFEPEGLAEWLVDQKKQFNSESLTMVHDIEAFLKIEVRRVLEDNYGAEWYKKGVPKLVFEEASTLAAKKNWDQDLDSQVEWWDCLHVVDYQKIMRNGGMKTWNELFDSRFTLPSDAKASSWKDKSEWVTRFNEIRNTAFHGNAVSEEDYAFLLGLHASFPNA